MGERGQEPPNVTPPVSELPNGYLARMLVRQEAGEIAATSWADADRRLALFRAIFGNRRADILTPGEVEDWINQQRVVPQAVRPARPAISGRLGSDDPPRRSRREP